ncbi:MAG: mechanosensitive ion channel family protein [Chloroflexota bacterium]|nr:mechanosensitive ion channel family protein [Chloroflexota bacterium]
MRNWFIILVVIIVACLIGVGVTSAFLGGEEESEGIWADIWSWFGNTGWRVLLYLGIGVIAYSLLLNIAPRLVRQTVAVKERGRLQEEVEQRANTLVGVITSTGSGVIVVVILFSILVTLGLNVTAGLAGLGVVGLAVGFGAQSLVKDLISGFFILLEDQYGVGDWIAISGVDGEVENLNLRRTIVRDLDGVVHSVPNGQVSVSSNYTKDFGRANIAISVAYKEDLERVLQLVKGTWEDLADDPALGPKVMSREPWILRVDGFGDSGITIRIVGETLPMWQWTVMAEMRVRLKRTFDELGIEIPWPHTKVFFGNMPSSGYWGSGNETGTLLPRTRGEDA